MRETRQVGLLDLQLGQHAPDRLEEGLAMLLHEGFEEGHGQHLSFAFVDAGGEVFVAVVAEQMAVQERAAAVRLHQEFDGGFFLCFAAEYLGDRAFHFAISPR